MHKLVRYRSSQAIAAALMVAALTVETLSHANAALGTAAEAVIDALPAVLVGVASAVLLVVGVIAALRWIRKIMG